MNDLEEDIKLLEKVCQRPIEETEGAKILKQAIENLINKYKEQEKMIELMVLSISSYDSQLVINNFKNKEDVKEFFRKKAR